MEYTIFTDAEYWQIKKAHNQLERFSIYNAFTYGRMCQIILPIIKQIMEQKLQSGE